MVALGMEDTSQDKVQLKAVHTMEGCIVQVLLLVVMQQDSHSHNSCQYKRNCLNRVHAHCIQHLPIMVEAATGVEQLVEGLSATADGPASA